MFFIVLYLSLGPCAYLVAAWVSVGSSHRARLLAGVGIAALLIGFVELTVAAVMAALIYQASLMDFLTAQIPGAAMKIRYGAYIGYGAALCAALSFTHSLIVKAHAPNESAR